MFKKFKLIITLMVFVMITQLNTSFAATNSNFEEENTNVIENAIVIAPNTTITGSLTQDLNVKYYCLIPQQSGAYKLNLERDQVDAHHYNLIMTDESNNPIKNLAGYFYLAENQNYYIKVWNDDTDNSISTYNFSITGPLVEDYGDTFNTSETVAIRQEIKGSLYTSEDCDVFKFTADSLYCEIEYEGIPYYALSLYDSSNNPLKPYIQQLTLYLDENSIINETIQIPSTVSYYDNLHPDEVYYIVIDGNTTPTEYRFTINSLYDDYANSIISAHEINIETPINGVTNYYGDEDLFKFTPESSGTYYIRLADYSDILLFTNKTNSIPNQIYPSNRDSFGLYYELEKGETYYVSAISTNNTSYTFEINGPLTVTPPDVIIGDINDDGSVNSLDFACLRMYLVGKINEFPSSSGRIAADINGDGSIDSLDFAILRKYLVGKISSL